MTETPISDLTADEICDQLTITVDLLNRMARFADAEHDVRAYFDIVEREAVTEIVLTIRRHVTG